MGEHGTWWASAYGQVLAHKRASQHALGYCWGVRPSLWMLRKRAAATDSVVQRWAFVSVVPPTLRQGTPESEISIVVQPLSFGLYGSFDDTQQFREVCSYAL